MAKEIFLDKVLMSYGFGMNADAGDVDRVSLNVMSSEFAVK